MPETDSLAERVLSLPTGTAIGEDEITKICQIIEFVLTFADEIKRELPRGYN